MVESDVLRNHIRGLLLNYALTHLTTDHVAWTHDAVSELLAESLTIVPTIDPHSVQLPVDPFDTLSKIWGLPSIEAYEERWSADPEAVRFLKARLNHPRTKTQVKDMWLKDDDVDFDRWQLRRPLSPILTSQALREAPRIGARSLADIVPTNHKELFDYSGIHAVNAPEETERSVSTDVVLNNRLPMNAEIVHHIPILLKSVPGIFRATDFSTECSHTHDFLRVASPDPTIVPLESPPIFPKDRYPGVINDDLRDLHPLPCLDTFRNIPELLGRADLTEREGHSQEDLYKQHMVIVDGWHAYEEPSSPLTPGTPSLGSSSSQFDELFLPPSPESPVLMQTLLSAQMDEHEFPRTEKPGGSSTEVKTLGDGDK
ncbi:hypothetical protein CERSUDRAFT_90789 [Gelatoporia subvermispora B]|uniref:Uncharacterized protein n=1 Tax=Ceriporiopsis subvermispora (strain B) TaxID=914234 RepID=M2RTB8_CERS8|nr:hypothetical protein CERSUDRAFT_90789 [Gelatoporia subvermispora B]